VDWLDAFDGIDPPNLARLQDERLKAPEARHEFYAAKKYVTPIANGTAIGAFALTEPQSGSDATAMRCRATKQADGSFIINGKKSWITSGPVAKYVLLFAMSDPDKPLTDLGDGTFERNFIRVQLPGAELRSRSCRSGVPFAAPSRLRPVHRARLHRR
jgi:alkylation response protein AidB-like acyl-CoA dehydrogenase